MTRKPFIAALPMVMLALLGCRGGLSKNPPVHLVDDMDQQLKVKAQMRSAFDFAAWQQGAKPDHRGMRRPPVGTIARGTLARIALAKFKDDAGNFIDNPLPASPEVLARGRQRFDIVCAVCHDRVGTGKGIVLLRAPLGSFNSKVPDLSTEQRIVDMKDGEICSIITMGKATMPAYGHMVPVHDRWAIVHYLRALQHRIKN